MAVDITEQLERAETVVQLAVALGDLFKVLDCLEVEAAWPVERQCKPFEWFFIPWLDERHCRAYGDHLDELLDEASALHLEDILLEPQLGRIGIQNLAEPPLMPPTRPLVATFPTTERCLAHTDLRGEACSVSPLRLTYCLQLARRRC